MLFSVVVQLAVLSGLVAAYPAAHDAAPKLQARDCSAHIDAFNMERRAKRSLSKRSFYPVLNNSTCIAAPNVAVQNWVANAPVTDDITGGQPGVSLLLDVGVMDMSSCQAMPNALVEVWHPNAAGQFGNFLRGGTMTSSTGISEISTIFPGRTAGESMHIGVKVHPKWSGGSTITSSAAAYTGSLYFTDGWNKAIGNYPPYSANTVGQTLNDADPTYAQANSGGYSAIVDIESIQDDWPTGVVGYITIGVHSS